MSNYKSNNDLAAVAGTLENAESIIGAVESSKLSLEDADERVQSSLAKVRAHSDKLGKKNPWPERALDDVSDYIDARYEYCFANVDNIYRQKLFNKMMALYKSVQNGLPKWEAHKRFTDYDDKLKSAVAHDVVVMLYLSFWPGQQDPENRSGNLVVDTAQAMSDARKQFESKLYKHLNKHDVDYEKIKEDYPVGTEADWYEYIENPLPQIYFEP